VSVGNFCGSSSKRSNGSGFFDGHRCDARQRQARRVWSCHHRHDDADAARLRERRRGLCRRRVARLILSRRRIERHLHRSRRFARRRRLSGRFADELRRTAAPPDQAEPHLHGLRAQPRNIEARALERAARRAARLTEQRDE
jgi:hypothetical protein